MIKNNEQLYTQLRLETRLSPARKEALFTRIRQEAASKAQKKPVLRRKWDFLRAAAATTCVAAMAISFYLLRPQQPASVPANSSLESMAEEVHPDSAPETDLTGETGTTAVTVQTTTAAISGSNPNTQTTASKQPDLSGGREDGQTAPGSTTTAATGSGGTGTTSVTQTQSALTSDTNGQQTSGLTETTAAATTTTTASGGEGSASSAGPASGIFCMPDVTCSAGDTFTLRLYAAEDLTLNGMVLDLDVENEMIDCPVPAYVSMNAVWFNDTDQEYSWNPPTLVLAPASAAAAVVPKDTCLIELTMKMPTDAPEGVKYSVYMSEYQSPENGGKLFCEPYLLCIITMQ